MGELLKFCFSWVSWEHRVWKIFLFVEQADAAWTCTWSIGYHSEISLHLTVWAMFPKEAGSINRSWIPAYLPVKMQLTLQMSVLELSVYHREALDCGAIL